MTSVSLERGLANAAWPLLQHPLKDLKEVCTDNGMDPWQPQHLPYPREWNGPMTTEASSLSQRMKWTHGNHSIFPSSSERLGDLTEDRQVHPPNGFCKCPLWLAGFPFFAMTQCVICFLVAVDKMKEIGGFRNPMEWECSPKMSTEHSC